MIKNSFIKKQAEKSRNEKKTSAFLRRLIFSVVEDSLKSHYGGDYSMKCLQSSVTIRELLDVFSINAKEYTGALCVSQVLDDDLRPVSWNGFWGDDHHVWVMTEFGELVDLTISALHLHPMSRNHKQEPTPSIWWNDTGKWPSILRYLPGGAVNICVPDQDKEDLETFKGLLFSNYEKTITNSDVKDVVFAPILDDMDSLNDLYSKGNTWARKSFLMQEANIPHPSWVRERENQLMEEYYNRNKT